MAWAKSQPFDTKVLLAAGLIELGEALESTHKDLGAAAHGAFARVIFLDAESAKAFAAGYGSAVEVLSKDTKPVATGSLLVCIGRMSAATIERLLPAHS